MEQKRDGEHEDSTRINLTRRQLLTATTAATLGGGLVGALAGRVVRFRRAGAGRAFFDLNGGPTWALNTAWFDGDARLLVEEGPGRLYLALTGARYPGTDLSADFEAEVLPAGAGEPLAADGNFARAVMNLNLALGNLSVRGLPLGRWLAGEAPAQGRANVSGECRLPGDCVLTASGRARATFSPDWSLHLAGSGIAALWAAGQQLAGDELTVRLLPRHSTRLSLQRGQQEWAAPALPAAPSHGSLAGERNLFDRATMELSSDGRSPARLTLQGGAAPALHFSPVGGLMGIHGEPLRVPLTNPTYTLTYAGDQVKQRSLIAQYSDEPVWVQTRGALLQLGRTEATPAFEWHETERESTAVLFRPALLALAASSMSGLIVQPVVADSSAAVSLAAEGDGLSIALESIEVIRPTDLLSLTFNFTDMELLLSAEQMPYLHPKTDPGVGKISVTFPPQHIAEEAVPVFDTSVLPRPEPSPPIASRAAGPSTLSFETTEDIDFTLESLLAWDRFTVPEGSGGSIEAPYKLYYQVEQNPGWLHAAGPVTAGKWTELWHTRSAIPMAMAVETKTTYGKMGPPAFETSPSQTDRIDMQTQTNEETNGIAPEKIDVASLMLSSLGAWMKASGEWDETLALKSYYHNMAMGRDIKVVVIRPGHLMPFGHKASLIILTERKFRKGRAYLHRKKFIVVGEPVKGYGGDAAPNDEREFPFRQVEVTSRVTPPLDSISDNPFWVRVAGTEYPFQLVATDWRGQTAEFSARLIFVGNRNGEPTNDTNVAAAIAEYTKAGNEGLRQLQLQGQSVAYAPPAPPKKGTKPNPDLAEGEEQVSSSDHTTALDTGILALTVGTYTNVRPYFRPKMAHAMVRVPALEQFVAEGQLVRVTLHPLFISSEFGGTNKWEVFAKLGQEWTPAMPQSTSGGIASPAIRFRALSRRFGAIGIDPVTGTEEYNPTQYFGENAKILGALPFASLLKPQPIDSPMTLAAAESGGSSIPIPKFTVAFERNEEELTEDLTWKKADVLRIGMELDVAGALGIQDIPNFFKTNYRLDEDGNVPEDEQTSLTLSASILRVLKAYPVTREVRQYLNSKGRTDPDLLMKKRWHYQVGGSLNWFALQLYFLTVYFESVSFTYDSSASKKMKPEIKLDPDFSLMPSGPLTFISMFLGKNPNEVAGSNPPEPEEEAIELGLSVRVPDFSSPPTKPPAPAPVPRWEFRNLEPWFKIKFYLDGSPIRFALGISYEEAPFMVLYWLKPEFALVGMGYFAIEFEPGQVRKLQVQLEAGVVLSIERALKIGILKGEVYVTVGFYFALEVDRSNRNSYEITGFLRLVGTVGLKVFEVSLEIYLAMSYRWSDAGDDYWLGTARITFTIKLWLFSFSWSYTYQQKLAGSKAGTAAYELPQEDRAVVASNGVTRRDVAAYCSAFSHSYAEGLV